MIGIGRPFNPQQMHDYGGGGGGPANPAGRYFYLVLRAGKQENALDAADIQKFYRSGVNTNEDYSFTLVDIASDDRLKNDLLRMEGGAEFYERLEASAPAFLITFVPIQKIVAAWVIQMYPVRDYAKDVQVIYDHMGMHRPSVRQAAIGFLQTTNSYLQLKPNIFGVGVNLNDVLADLIARLERASP